MKIVCLGQGARGMGGRLHYFIIARSTVVCQYYLEKCLKKILPEIAQNGLDIHFLGVLNQSNRCRYLGETGGDRGRLGDLFSSSLY